MQFYALFMFLGIFTTFLIPETKRKTLEELSGEEDLYASSRSAGADLQEFNGKPSDTAERSKEA